jgi:V8-like Glu-specific endopeptidase
MPRLQIALFIMVIPLLVSANDHISHVEQRIVKGSLTSKQPAVGSLLLFDDVNQQWKNVCSASLIDHSTVLTAAHCVCQTDGNNCQPDQFDAPQPKQFLLYFQNAGLFRINSISLPQQYDFPASDYAVINLRNNVRAIEPLQLATIQPANNTTTQLIGYGRTAQQDLSSAGLLRSGPILLSDCNAINLDKVNFLCWKHSPESQLANSCNGDSGGSLLSDNGRTLLGIISGGVNNCDQADTGFATTVAAIRKDVLTRSKYLAPWHPTTLILDRVYSASASLAAFSEKTYHLIVEPSNAEKIVVSTNATDTIGIQTRLTVDSDTASCKSARPGSYQSCILKQPGNRPIEISLYNNSNEPIIFQLSASELNNRCNLDIDDNGTNHALTDGLLLIRALFGFQGSALIDHAVAANSKRKTSEEILNYIHSDVCMAAMDIDFNGTVDALTDGIIILRYLFGAEGMNLIQGIAEPRQLPVIKERIALLVANHKTTYLELQL